MGELLYCYTRGLTSCCFVDEECGGTWQVINDDMTQKAVDFMRAPLMVVRLPTALPLNLNLTLRKILKTTRGKTFHGKMRMTG